MFRYLIAAANLSFVLVPPAFAQTDADVAAGRDLFLAGNYAEALVILRPAAEAGMARAQNILGLAYQDDKGVALN